MDHCDVLVKTFFTCKSTREILLAMRGDLTRKQTQQRSYVKDLVAAVQETTTSANKQQPPAPFGKTYDRAA